MKRWFEAKVRAAKPNCNTLNFGLSQTKLLKSSLASGLPYMASSAPSGNPLNCRAMPCEPPKLGLQLAYGACHILGFGHSTGCSCVVDRVVGRSFPQYVCRATLANLWKCCHPSSSSITSDLEMSLHFYTARNFVATFGQLLVSKPDPGHIQSL